MSENVWQFIADRVCNKDNVGFLEYGSGGSTLYLYRLLFDHVRSSDKQIHSRLASVESDSSWFMSCSLFHAF